MDSTMPQHDPPSVTSVFDQRWKRWRSVTGTPSISAMMVVGTGWA
jgi:hypothetical protein